MIQFKSLPTRPNSEDGGIEHFHWSVIWSCDPVWKKKFFFDALVINLYMDTCSVQILRSF